MKGFKKILVIAFLIAYWQLSIVNCFAQNIGINQANPDASALLDMTSTERGLLIPRVDLDDATTAAPVTSPAEGLLIYNETGTEPHGFYYWDGTLWVMFSSGSSSSSSATCDHTIGESYGGGIVFYVSSDGCHGLISDTQDQYAAEYWDHAFDGLNDPSLHSTEGGKYFDWRMPSKWELNQMYIQRATIGGFASARYWCSIHNSSNENIWYHDFSTGTQSVNTRTNSYHVRAVRAF